MRYLKAYNTTITDEERLFLIFEAFSEKYIFWGVDLYIKDPTGQIQCEHLNFFNDVNVKALVKRKIGRHHSISTRNWLLAKCNQIHFYGLRQKEYLKEPVNWNSRYTGILYELEMSPEPPLIPLEENPVNLHAIGLQKTLIGEEEKKNVIPVESVINRPLVQAEMADMSQFGQQLYEIEFLRQNIESAIASIIEQPCFILPTQIEWETGEKILFWSLKPFNEKRRVGNVLLGYLGPGDKRIEGVLGYIDAFANRFIEDENQSLLTLVDELKIIKNPVEKTGYS
ncbi:MAG: hypothetical protein ACFFCQ_04175 [Promethearchaeota archaeon]